MLSVPLAALAGVRGTPAAARNALFLGVVGTYSLFPLHFRQEESPIKVGGQSLCHAFLRG